MAPDTSGGAWSSLAATGDPGLGSRDSPVSFQGTPPCQLCIIPGDALPDSPVSPWESPLCQSHVILRDTSLPVPCHFAGHLPASPVSLRGSPPCQPRVTPGLISLPVLCHSRECPSRQLRVTAGTPPCLTGVTLGTPPCQSHVTLGTPPCPPGVAPSRTKQQPRSCSRPAPAVTPPGARGGDSRQLAEPPGCPHPALTRMPRTSPGCPGHDSHPADGKCGSRPRAEPAEPRGHTWGHTWGHAGTHVGTRDSHPGHGSRRSQSTSHPRE